MTTAVLLITCTNILRERGLKTSNCCEHPNDLNPWPFKPKSWTVTVRFLSLLDVISFYLLFPYLIVSCYCYLVVICWALLSVYSKTQDTQDQDNAQVFTVNIAIYLNSNGEKITVNLNFKYILVFLCSKLKFK